MWCPRLASPAANEAEVRSNIRTSDMPRAPTIAQSTGGYGRIDCRMVTAAVIVMLLSKRRPSAPVARSRREPLLLQSRELRPAAGVEIADHDRHGLGQEDVLLGDRIGRRILAEEPSRQPRRILQADAA